MRSVRLTAALGVVVSALAVAATPALAKEKTIFGEFTASITGKTLSEAEPGVTKGHGEISEFKLGPYKITCEKEIKSKGEVTEERSETFLTEVKFPKCTTESRVGSIVEIKGIHFKAPLSLEYYSNGSAEAAGSSEAGVKIGANEATLKVGSSKCTILIPAQRLPSAAEKSPEKEYEAAEYSTETEAVEGKKNLQKYPSGFREKLDITMEFKKILSLVKPNEKCLYSKGEEGAFNPVTGYVEFKNGILEAELEEVELVGGELGFAPPA